MEEHKKKSLCRPAGWKPRFKADSAFHYTSVPNFAGYRVLQNRYPMIISPSPSGYIIYISRTNMFTGHVIAPGVLKWIAWLFTLICPPIIRVIELNAQYGHAESRLCRLDVNNWAQCHTHHAVVSEGRLYIPGHGVTGPEALAPPLEKSPAEGSPAAWQLMWRRLQF